MRKNILAIILLFFGAVAALAELNKDEIKRLIGLTEKDNYRLTSVITQYKNDRVEKIAKFVILIANNDSLAIYREPPENKGQIVLQKGADYFLYFPKPQKYIRVSARNVIFGSVSFGDLVKPPLLKYYEPVKWVKNMNSQKEELYKIWFVLKDEVRDIPYYTKVVAYNKTRDRIESQDAYSRSGILLGKTTNLDFTGFRGVNLASRTKLFDIRDPRAFAIQQILTGEAIAVPGYLFSPSFLTEIDGYLARQLPGY